METTVENLRYDFSEAELVDIARTMAEKNLEVEDLEAAKKAVVAGYSDKIASANLEKRSASRCYRDGYEHRDVVCNIVRDYGDSTISYIRQDTGELVKIRKMTDQEKQMRIEDA